MRARADRFDITPTVTLDQGSGNTASDVDVTRPPAETLEANILALWPDDDDSGPVLLVTLDLLYPGAAVREAVERGAEGLAPERIVVAASHTHRAPMTDAEKPLLGRADDDYLAWLTKTLTRRVRDVLDVEHAPLATLSAGSAVAAHSVNRRRRVRLLLGFPPRRNVMARLPDRDGPVDETVIVGSVDDVEGHPIARFWNYACHPVAHPDPQVYSSHYPHTVRERMRAQAQEPAMPVLYFQGFSGDTRPTASIGVRDWRALIHRVVSGPQFRHVMRPSAYRAWSASLADRAMRALHGAAPIAVDAIRTRRITRPLSEFADGPGPDVTFQSVRFSDDLLLVGMSGEPVVEYATVVRAMGDARLTMCAGCVDDVFGYVPTARMIVEGGYESEGFCASFGLRSISPDVEKNTRAALVSLLSP